ncbi:3-hydroxyisobutyrate dehydrogenase [Spirosoma sp. HMF4905]|uniref:3-hydroxyisobutyrate dehydrogenase n=1 Tax=Spirosoma arboris TaxID=2682092 RepID=A0A7K1SJ86_9BACT|nr:NAD(P)-binding domain-containing protein [Spirosoma arboris]MVM33862.1 3-hydroxyisobutyrate dehydrogenase [Spirosoma arboris]
METLQFGFIGVGLIGEVLVRKLVAAGHHVKMTNSRGPETLQPLANEIGAQAVTVDEVVQNVDVVFLVIPQKNIVNLPNGLFRTVRNGTIVVDVGNYYPIRDGVIDDIENGLTESEWVEKQIGYPIIKVFNSINWRSLDALSMPKGTIGRIALPISGDDVQAKQRIATLVDQLGYEPHDAGTIADSWRQQPGSPIYCTNVTKEELLEWLSKVERFSLPQRLSLGLKLHAELVAQHKETDARAYGQAMKDALMRATI